MFIFCAVECHWLQKDTISLPQDMHIARTLPLLPKEVGVIILRRTGALKVLKQYTARRDTVKRA